MARLHDAEGRHAKKSEQHEEATGHAEGDGNIAADARIAEQSGQAGAQGNTAMCPRQRMQAMLPDSSALIGFIRR